MSHDGKFWIICISGYGSFSVDWSNVGVNKAKTNILRHLIVPH